MNILQITANFAPRGTSQTVRTVNMAKAFVSAGKSLEILTYDEDTLTLFSPYDEALSVKVPREVCINRVHAGPLRKWLIMRKQKGDNPTKIKQIGGQSPWISILIPDPHIDAVPAFVRAARRIVKRFHPDLILTHGYPFSTHLVGYFLKKKYPNMRWIADYGDPWCGAPITELYRPRWRELLDYHIERHMLKRVDLVTVTTEPTRELYVRSFPEIGEKIHVVPMGYDPDDFRNIEPKQRVEEDNAKLCFVHTGRLYNRARNPRPLLEAVEILLRMNPELMDKLSIIFVGEVESAFYEMIRSSSACKVFQFIPWSPVNESIAWMKAADCLLLFGNRGRVQIPGKIYQYLGAQKPIMMIYESESDPTLEVIKDCSAVAVENDCHEILSFFQTALKENRFDNPKSNSSVRFSWPVIMKNLIERIEDDFNS